ncbi:NAD(P)/FAD-dependent oxidoreductase [Sanyastnella coralliicola]|uniref:NAD(P)/FAD-dependent oxidoreductase n=1 Tax=Sanyastnella coralliicola TaxID=3069118 RepID=UPI0027BA32A4|nr:NAD(P)/FAD-dependent oxidoreductase [Longitalea sp. SCSIO 12813]
MSHTVIIGNGISGVTAARHIRKRSDDRITIISAETDHFFSRTALMYIYMGHMTYENTKPFEDHFWSKNRIDLMREYVSTIDYAKKTLQFSSGGTLAYDKLILAVGSKPNKFGWPGQDLDGVQGLYSYQDLELLEKNTHGPLVKDPAKKKVKRAVLVGGGLIGVEFAEMLLTRGIEVTFLVREDRFWGNVLPKEEGELVARHMIEHHVDLRLNTELAEVIPDENGRAKAIKTKDGETIECQLVGLTAGVSPNVAFLKGGELEIDRGILVDEYLKTNIPDVYAIGDCAQMRNPSKGRRPLEQVWYTGRMMGETVGATLTGTPTPYKPGYWFNSAKFFDIEYQTYGTVPARDLDGLSEFYWEHPDGKICIKIVFETATRRFHGINTFGIRMLHERFDKWLNEERSVDHIMEYLADANFDPEFYRTHEKAVVNKFNAEQGTAIVPKKRSWKRIFSKA